MNVEHLEQAKEMAAKVTAALGGAGLWGVEFFITKDGAVFSELSPRPHDTGMVTLAGTQSFNEFELHARAILNIPIPQISYLRNGASAVILANNTNNSQPRFLGIEKAAMYNDTDFRLFGKPTSRPYRRMGVTLAYGEQSVTELVEKAKEIASYIEVI
jgi:phosphoribosylglycinamide formyltransferase 2